MLSGARLGVLDVLRGVAVLLVLAQHVGELAAPAATRAVSGQVVQLGQAGVMLFFLCSGFIIPVSLERLGSLRRFWVRRALRLYPLYWVSLVAALVLTLLGLYPRGETLSPVDWWSNVTMVQGFLGHTDAVGLYWSLAWEMAFYLAMSALFLLRAHRSPVLLSVACSLGVTGVTLAAWATGLSDALPVGVVAFVLMFQGTVWFAWLDGRVRTRSLVLVVAASLAATAVLAAVRLDGADPTGAVVSARGPMLAAWWGSMAVFAVGMLAARRGTQGLPALAHIGVISFSVYLLQGLVLGAVRLPGAPPVVQAVVWVALTMVLSELSHRFIERPAIRLGRHWSRGSRGSAQAPGAAENSPVLAGV